MKPPINPKPKTKDRKSMQFYLSWVNNTVGEYPSKLLDLSTGVAYCKILNKLYPGSVKMDKLKEVPRLDTDFMDNLNLVKDGLERLKVKKQFNSKHMIEGSEKVENNYDLMQWFYDFYQANSKEATSKKSIAKSDTEIKQAVKFIISSNKKATDMCMKRFGAAVNGIKNLEDYQGTDASVPITNVRASCFNVMKDFREISSKIDRRYVKHVKHLYAELVKTRGHAQTLAAILKSSLSSEKVREIVDANNVMIKSITYCNDVTRKEIKSLEKRLISVDPKHKLHKAITEMNDNLNNAINAATEDLTKRDTTVKVNIEEAMWVMRHEATVKARDIFSALK